MAEQTIICPHCNKEIELTEALSGRIKEEVRKDFEGRVREKELELKKAQEDLTRRGRALEDSKRALEESYEIKLAVEKVRLADEARKRASEQVDVELKDLKERNSEKERLLAGHVKAELDMRKKMREMEEERKRLDLDVARRMDDEREKVRQTTLEMFSEEHRLKDLEKDKQMHDMRRTIDELKRKSEQGSMQTQGEVLELDLEGLLKARFPVDAVEPVPKGIRGADILQKVYTRSGQYCGSIAWESKRTKAWSDEWITKLKDDQREVKAEVAVLVTEAMPRGVSSFACVDGVWVTAIPLAVSLAEALRAGLVQLAQSKLSAVGKNEKMEAIYNYLSGSEFRQRIEAIVEAFRSMKDDLDREKTAMMKMWSKREKQIERVVDNTARMYGDMQGIITTLPEINALELGPGADEPDND
ncbi:MAG: DUF2130 domain-containing protein [Deltaproteobacteria bacterium]